MRIPEKLVICGVTYKVSLMKGSIDADEEFGRINYSAREIRIQDHGAETNWATLLHEMMHGLSFHYGLRLDDTEEKHQEMDALASILMDTLARNNIIKVG